MFNVVDREILHEYLKQFCIRQTEVRVGLSKKSAGFVVVMKQM